jgi:hypothetical protein
MNSGFRFGENMAGIASEAKLVREPITNPRPRKARKPATRAAPAAYREGLAASRSLSSRIESWI